MTDLKVLAKYLVYAYENYTNSQFENSEMKLHKLLYLAQRESLALFGEKLFDEDFEGWVHGPVIPELRFFFETGYSALTRDELNSVSEREKYIISNVLDQYAQFETWALRNLTHEENSWKKSRKGLTPNEHGNKIIKIEDIKSDAENVRLYDHVWGMYLDEFDDCNEGEHVQ